MLDIGNPGWGESDKECKIRRKSKDKRESKRGGSLQGLDKKLAICQLQKLVDIEYIAKFEGNKTKL